MAFAAETGYVGAMDPASRIGRAQYAGMGLIESDISRVPSMTTVAGHTGLVVHRVLPVIKSLTFDFVLRQGRVASDAGIPLCGCRQNQADTKQHLGK